MALARSLHVVGDADVSQAAPSVRVVEDALVVPQTGDIAADTAWGVYDASLRLVEEAAYIRGPGRNLVGQCERSAPIEPARTFEGEYVYGGSAHAHYGHYLLSFLPRYWLGQAECVANRKILIHQVPNIEGWLKIPFVEQTLAALGLDASCFIAVNEPARVESLVVPAPSFVETQRVHAVFSDMCTWIGHVLSHRIRATRSSQPLFLSKGRLGSGVWNIVNERPFLDAMEAAGVRIVFPETMALGEQIALFEAHETIAGMTGSALHTSAFCSAPKRIVGLGHNHFLWSNFALIDAVKGHEATYWYPEGGMISQGPSDRFSSTFAFADPVATGTAFARLLV